jgi:hypothetical protein
MFSRCPVAGSEELVRLVIRIYTDPTADGLRRENATDLFDRLMGSSGYAWRVLEEWDRGQVSTLRRRSDQSPIAARQHVYAEGCSGPKSSGTMMMRYCTRTTHYHPFASELRILLGYPAIIRLHLIGGPCSARSACRAYSATRSSQP